MACPSTSGTIAPGALASAVVQASQRRDSERAHAGLGCHWRAAGWQEVLVRGPGCSWPRARRATFLIPSSSHHRTAPHPPSHHPGHSPVPRLAVLLLLLLLQHLSSIVQHSQWRQRLPISGQHGQVGNLCSQQPQSPDHCGRSIVRHGTAQCVISQAQRHRPLVTLPHPPWAGPVDTQHRILVSPKSFAKHLFSNARPKALGPEVGAQNVVVLPLPTLFRPRDETSDLSYFVLHRPSCLMLKDSYLDPNP